MTSLAQKIYQQALDLPIDDRLILIDQLIRSANLPTQSKIDRLWSQEVERRNKKIDDGSSVLIPGEEVIEKIKKKFVK